MIVADFTGLALARAFCYQNNDIRLCEDVCLISKQEFEDKMDMAVKDGIFCLEENYWISMVGVKKPEIVNTDFKDKAKGWLLQETYKRTSGGKKLNLMESITLRVNEKGMIVIYHPGEGRLRYTALPSLPGLSPRQDA